MEVFLFILAALMAVAAFALHRSADKSERKFANRPAVVTNPAKDLLTNQKYAIVKFLAPDFITFLRHHIAHNDNQRVT